MHLESRPFAARRQMAYAAAAMFGGAAFVVATQALTQGGPTQDPIFGIAAFVVAVALVAAGGRLPLAVLASLGPIGALMIAGAVATTPGAADGAALYIWPVLWTAYFFGRIETVLIVAWVGVVHGGALVALGDGDGYFDRWIDVMVSVAVVAAVVQTLSHRNRQLLERFAAEARVDALTGLLNRRGFEQRVPTELARANRDDAWVSIASFDIDYFKRVNDEWGHDVGDRVLARLGGLLAEHTRDGDVAARMGGEEFVVLLWAADPEQAQAYAERVRTEFADGGSRDDGGRVTVSAGVSSARAPAAVEPLIQRADTALYRAKCEGRDRTVVHDAPQLAA